MKNWLLENQVKIALAIAAISLLIILLLDFRGWPALFASIISLGLIYLGSRLFESDTTENWMKISYGHLLKGVVGGVLLLFGWILLLRAVVATAIASILLWLG